MSALDQAVTVRPATSSDADSVHDAVVALLEELSGQPRDVLAGFAATFERLVTDPERGGILVAVQASGGLLGVLTYSRQHSLRTGGPYLLVQELWVSARARGLGVGRELVASLWRLAGDDVSDVEVGLPAETFAGRADTEAFYQRAGFSLMGPRARARRPAG